MYTGREIPTKIRQNRGNLLSEASNPCNAHGRNKAAHSVVGNIPPQFDTGSLGDPFMETVIKSYSVHENDKFYVPHDKAKELAQQVLELDADMKPGQAKSRISDDFEKYWAHYDVLSEGKIYSNQIVPFMQALAHDSGLQCTLKPAKPYFCEEMGTCCPGGGHYC